MEAGQKAVCCCSLLDGASRVPRAAEGVGACSDLALLFLFAVCYLLKSNISPDLCNEDGLTALHQVRLQDGVLPGVVAQSLVASPRHAALGSRLRSNTLTHIGMGLDK